MYLPPSGPFTHLLLGVEMVSSYIVLYPLKSNTTSEVIRCLRTHLSLFPHFAVAKTDLGAEMSKALTEFLALFSIHHYSSIPVRSQSNGHAEISIKNIRKLINQIVDSLGLNRNHLQEMLPFIANGVNQTQLSSAKGPVVVQSLCAMLWNASRRYVLIQESIYERILNNRQNILLDRQEQFRTSNGVFKAGQLVF